MAFILKKGADGVPVAAVCLKAGISQGADVSEAIGMPSPEIWRLKQLGDENAKLRKLAADLSLGRC